MDPPPSPGTVFRFGVFQLDLRARELRKSGHRIRLQEHSFKILSTLLEHPGEVVTREEIRQKLWPDGTVVDFDNGVNAAMGKLRQALRDTADRPRYIETIPRVGYRLIAEASAVAPPFAAVEERAAPPDSVPAIPGGGGRRLVAAWIAAAVLLSVAGYVGYRTYSRASLPRRQTLVVLPFLCLDPDPGAQYLADGITEELTTQLTQLEPQRLAVIARTSAMAYRGSTKTIAAIATELGADHVLEGSIRHSGERVRITAQLIRASDQTHIWAGDYDRDLGDVLNLESEIAGAVADLIRGALRSGKQPGASNERKVVPAAYDACLKGRYYLWSQERNSSSLARAQEYFQKAVDIDPGYAAPYAGLAEYHAILAESEVGAKEHSRQAQAYAAKALTLDQNLAEAHMELAFMAAVSDRDWKYADDEFRRALELDPNLVRARALRAAYLLAVGRPDEAVEEIRRAQQQDPLSLILRHQTTRTLYLARRYQETINEGRKKLELNPGASSSLASMGMAYAKLGQSAEALKALAEYERKSNGSPAPAVTRTLIYAWTGQSQLARQALEELQASVNNGNPSAYFLAVGYASLGDRDHALSWLEKAYDTNDGYLNLRLNPDPALDGLRSEPRFREIVRRMKYPGK